MRCFCCVPTSFHEVIREKYKYIMVEKTEIFSHNLQTTIYTDTRYNDKIRYNDNLTHETFA